MSTGYRMGGDLEVRAKELEQDLIGLQTRVRELECDRWQAQRTARTYKALLGATIGTSAAGLGAAIGSATALSLYLLEIVTAPPMLLGIVVSGSLLRLLVEARKAGDDGFPPAPPPRFH